MFAVNRFAMNKGCPNSATRWLFEEFMFTDSLFGRAIVSFVPKKVVTIDGWQITIHDPVVDECIVFDDDGNVVPLTLEQMEECKRIVLEAFAAIEEDVRNHLRGVL